MAALKPLLQSGNTFTTSLDNSDQTPRVSIQSQVSLPAIDFGPAAQPVEP